MRIAFAFQKKIMIVITVYIHNNKFIGFFIWIHMCKSMSYSRLNRGRTFVFFSYIKPIFYKLYFLIICTFTNSPSLYSYHWISLHIVMELNFTHSNNYPILWLSKLLLLNLSETGTFQRWYVIINLFPYYFVSKCFDDVTSACFKNNIQPFTCKSVKYRLSTGW